MNKNFNEVSEIPLEYKLITDSQEIEKILNDIGIYLDFGCLFVLTGDGDYISIYGCEYSVPLLDHKVSAIY